MLKFLFKENRHNLKFLNLFNTNTWHTSKNNLKIDKDHLVYLNFESEMAMDVQERKYILNSLYVRQKLFGLNQTTVVYVLWDQGPFLIN